MLAMLAARGYAQRVIGVVAQPKTAKPIASACSTAAMMVQLWNTSWKPNQRSDSWGFLVA